MTTVEALEKALGSHRSLMIRRQTCLHLSRTNCTSLDPLKWTNQISEAVLDAELAKMSTSDWGIFLFLKGLDAPGDAQAKAYLMQFYETSDRKGEKLTLSNMHDEWVRFLQTKSQTKIVSHSSPKTSADVNKISVKYPPKKPAYIAADAKSDPPKTSKNVITCYRCGAAGHMQYDCPEKRPQKKNYKAPTREVKCISVEGVAVESGGSKKRSLSVKVGGRSVACQLDTVSDITLLSKGSWVKLGSPKLEPVPHKIVCANGSALDVLGRTKVSFELKGVEYVDYAYVSNRENNLLGMSWVSHSPEMRDALDVLVTEVVEVNQEEASRVELALKQAYPEVFTEGLGLCCKEDAKFRVNETAVPVFKRARPVPYGSLQAVEQELNRLLDLEVLEPITHSDWAAPIVVIRKKDTGKVRVCADFKCSGLNNSLIEEIHPLPTSDDLFGTLQGCIFSKIDLKDAYLQIALDSESQKLAVINTHKGLFKYRRMTFGLKPAPAKFQKIIDKMIAGLPGVAAYLDDVIVSANSLEEHEKVLHELLKRIKDYGFRISPEKCNFAQSEITFLGFIIDKRGRRPDPKKTSVIRSMKAPTDQKQLMSFLGAICFYGRFVPKMSELRGPLDKLLKKDADWIWTDVEQKAFEELRKAVADSTMLSHFNSSWPIIVAADASKYGIGGVILHVNPDGVEVPIAHFARSLTETEKRYSQIEKEALALIYTVKKSHKFVFGRRFKLQTDHRPLLALFGDNRDLPVHSQNRIVRWATTLMSYDFELSYVATEKFAKADWLSRMIQDYPRNEDDVVIAEILEDFENEELGDDSRLSPVLEKDVREKSALDRELAEVTQYVETDGWRARPLTDVEKYWGRLRQRLKVLRGCLLLDDRVVVPKSLQMKVLRQLHEGHPGVVRMKQKACSFVFWTGIDKDVEKLVRGCENCQESAKMPRVAPLRPWPEPQKAWSRVHIDFAGPVNGHWFLVIVDAKSKYAEVKMTKTISASATVSLLEEVFATHGYPELLVSDNGTQFTSNQFKLMCQEYGMEHKTSAVYYPRSNGAAERFVDSLKRGLAKITRSGVVTQQALNKFLICYRNTPHSALAGATPAECHFGRKIRTKMSLLVPSREIVEGPLSDCQNRMKFQYDSRNAARAKTFELGQYVYVRVQKGNVWSWEHGEVIKRLGEVLYEVQVGSRVQRTHVNQLRKKFVGDSEDVLLDTVYPCFFDCGLTGRSRIASITRGRYLPHISNISLLIIPSPLARMFPLSIPHRFSVVTGGS